MFQKLHRHMTLFCTLVTGSILLIMTMFCLFFAERSIRENNYSSFMTQLGSVLIYLQEQDTISHPWISRLREDNGCLLFLYDRETPLIYQDYHDSPQETQLAQETIREASSRGMDIFSSASHDLTQHIEFRFTSSAGQNYNASAGQIPKQNGRLGYLLLFPLKKQQTQLLALRLTISLAGTAALLLLFIFSHLFTKRMLQPARESQKKQMLFIASASHELRAPLAVFRSGLEALQKSSSPAEMSHFIDIMTEENSHMQNLVDQMLLLANMDSHHLPMQPELCQPDSLMLHAYEAFEPLAAKKEITLSIQLPEQLLPDCLCDRERMLQVFSILMDNALSYTPPGGRVTLSLTFQKARLLFCFADTGCGIPAEDRDLIFERFYRSGQAHTKKEHFGLGLCIAREIILAHKGAIWVEAGEGQGSRFFVSLPAVPSDTRNRAGDKVPRPPRSPEIFPPSHKNDCPYYRHYT